MLGAEGSVLGAKGSVLGAKGSVLGAEGSVLGAIDAVLGAKGNVLGAKESVLGVEKSVLVGGSHACWWVGRVLVGAGGAVSRAQMRCWEPSGVCWGPRSILLTGQHRPCKQGRCQTDRRCVGKGVGPRDAAAVARAVSPERERRVAGACGSAFRCRRLTPA